MDIEGAEHRVLPHLLHTRAMCLINRVYMEWHGSFMKSWFLDALMNQRHCEAGHSKVLYKDFVATRNDDETYRTDGKPWPAMGAPCHRRSLSHSRY